MWAVNKEFWFWESCLAHSNHLWFDWHTLLNHNLYALILPLANSLFIFRASYGKIKEKKTMILFQIVHSNTFFSVGQKKWFVPLCCLEHIFYDQLPTLKKVWWFCSSVVFLNKKGQIAERWKTTFQMFSHISWEVIKAYFLLVSKARPLFHLIACSTSRKL